MPKDNTGKKAVTYIATLDDGTVLRKKSFNIKEPKAYIGYFSTANGWYAAGVFRSVDSSLGVSFVEAHIDKGVDRS